MELPHFTRSIPGRYRYLYFSKGKHLAYEMYLMMYDCNMYTKVLHGTYTIYTYAKSITNRMTQGYRVLNVRQLYIWPGLISTLGMEQPIPYPRQPPTVRARPPAHREQASASFPPVSCFPRSRSLVFLPTQRFPVSVSGPAIFTGTRESCDGLTEVSMLHPDAHCAR